MFYVLFNIRVEQKLVRVAGADPGFLGRGFLCTKSVRVRLAVFISFLSNIP